MDHDNESNRDIFKSEIDILCEDVDEPCTKGDLLQAMHLVYDLITSENEKK